MLTQIASTSQFITAYVCPKGPISNKAIGSKSARVEIPVRAKNHRPKRMKSQGQGPSVSSNHPCGMGYREVSVDRNTATRTQALKWAGRVGKLAGSQRKTIGNLKQTTET